MELSARAAYRGQVTKITKAATDFLNDGDSQLSEENATKFDDIEEELVSYIQRLKVAHESLCAANVEVRNKLLVKPEDLDKELEKAAEYEDTAIGVLARLNSRLQKLQQKQNPVLTRATVLSNNTAASKNPTKLPKLSLKRFTGSYEEWLPFWEQFRTAVHENSSLSGSEKFNYLESVLEGTAKRTIAGFTPTETCYDAAIALLQEQFGDTEKLIDKHMHQLISLRPVLMKSDTLGLRNLYNSIMSCTRSLTALKVPSNQYYVMLKSILLRCLPSELRIDYHRIQERDEGTSEKGDCTSEKNSSTLSEIGDGQVQNILRFLKREVESLEKAQEGKSRTTSTTKGIPTTAAGLMSVSAKEACLFCKASEHSTGECNSSISLSEKRDLLRKNGRCFRCAARGHISQRCRNKWISCKICKGKHFTSLCVQSYQKTAAVPVPAVEDAKQEKSPVYVNDNNGTKRVLNLCAYNSEQQISNVYLKTARCIAIAPCRKENLVVRVVIDGGSQHTYLRESVAIKLNLASIGTVNLSVIPFGSREQSPFQRLDKVKLVLKSQFGCKSVDIEAIVVPEICVDVLGSPDSSCVSLKGLELADTPQVNVEAEDGLSLLIGSDYYWTVVTGKQRRISERLRAVETIFGWTLQGPQHVSSSQNSNVNACCSCISSNILCISNQNECDFTQFWSLEAIGIQSEEAENISLTENLINKCIVKGNSRYVASLPWKDLKTSLDNNREQALARLCSLTKRLSRNPNHLFEYDTAMRQLISSGIAEPVIKKSNKSAERVFYLPHRPVYKKESTTTRLRIVFDASSHAEDALSLNEQLWTGSNLLPDVVKILLNFRLGRYGVVADIEKAFLQILLDEKDRDSHRFVWYSTELDSASDLPAYQDYRMTRVTFGVTCSPFLLAATIKSHLEIEKDSFPSTCAILKESFYMDDLVFSVDSAAEGQRICEESLVIMSRAAMNLRKWNSNSLEVRSVVQSSNFPAIQKVLGLRWYIFSDEIAVPLEAVESLLNTPVTKGTKRNVLATIARVFDPLGILGPVVIKLKILFQSIWKKKMSWDEKLPEELMAEWNECAQSLLVLKDLTIPRSAVTSSRSDSVQVHIFADASMKAYGSVAFIRCIDAAGTVNVSLLCAKSRVAPLKEDKSPELTLPKLELTAALIAARLCSYLRKSLKIIVERFYMWTDSKIALNWIQGELYKWKPYVQSRVTEIRRLTQISDWRHCIGKENPADLCTRGISGLALQKSSLWFEGPEWLKSDERSWRDVERAADPVLLTSLLAETCFTAVTSKEPLLRYENFSTWKRLLRVTGYVLRFITLLRKVPRTSLTYLTAADLNTAEAYWLRYVQWEAYYNEICALQKGRPLSKASNIAQLSPFLDTENLLRLGGRLQSLEESENFKHPVILPSHSHVTNLIIDDFHNKTMHGGVSVVLTHLRERFWIVRGRQLVKKRVKSCSVCRKLWCKPVSQPFAPLPRERITLSKPFDNTGIDFAGPLYCHDNNNRGTSKVYIMIFTCAAIRAVHLELVTSLTTSDCLLALRRFMARRGVPSSIYSDNAKTFRRASLELDKAGFVLEDEVLQGFLAQRRIKWNFIVERAPWWGGFWERLIRTMKNTLKVVIGKAKLNFEQLRTVVTETEGIVNSRPLTYTSSDPLDLSPLTPSHFLLGCRSTVSNKTAIGVSTHDEIHQIWRQRMKFTSMLWKRWRTEYLQLLRSFHHNNSKPSTNLSQNDVVLVFDSATPRIHWKLALIEKIFPGRDGKIRSCEIRYADGKRTRRPVQLLYPMEVSTDRPAGGC